MTELEFEEIRGWALGVTGCRASLITVEALRRIVADGDITEDHARALAAQVGLRWEDAA